VLDDVALADAYRRAGLPVRVLDPELDVLVDAVSGPSAAVWVVQSLPLRSWGLDAERRLRSTLREDYSVAAVVCDRRIHLRDGLQRPPVDRSADPRTAAAR